MKKIIFLIGSLSCFSFGSIGCDLCSIYMNLEPNDLKSSIGFNYRYRLFEHSINHAIVSENTDKHNTGSTVLSETIEQQELFKSYDLWVNYFINSKWQLWGNITFADNSYLENDSVLYNISGPGDLTMIAKRLIYNTRSDDSSGKAIRFVLGGGTKLPTGSYNKTYMVTPSSESKGNVVYGTPYEELDPHMQTGTGSIDFIILSEFLIRFKGIGFSTLNSYRMNTKNSNQFRFANRFNSTTSIFYLWKINQNAIAPSIGLNYEYSKRDLFRREKFLHSGGNALFLSMGAKFYVNKLAIGAAYLNPIRQQLNDNQLNNKKRVTVDLTYYF